MLKNLKRLLKLRAWVKSGTLKLGAGVGVAGWLLLGQDYLTGCLSSGAELTCEGAELLETIGGWVGLSGSAFVGAALNVLGLAIIYYRARTEKDLDARADDE